MEGAVAIVMRLENGNICGTNEAEFQTLSSVSSKSGPSDSPPKPAASAKSSLDVALAERNQNARSLEA
eukprot:4583504-Karenia_brevis.AAC.1